MKAVLISIRPKWCELIASGKKSIEIRKTRPKIETPFKCYIYCTKPSFEYEDFIPLENGRFIYGGGKVIGEFVCDRITEICLTDEGYDFDCPKMTALSYAEMEAYLGRKRGYGWHISALKIYDEPKNLSEFCRPCPKDHDCTACDFWFPTIMDFDRCEPPCCGFWEDNASMIRRAPESWCYVESLERGNDNA